MYGLLNLLRSIATASFVLLTGMVAAYAPFLVGLGLLSRLGSGWGREFAFYAAAISASIFYSIACGPLWSTVAAVPSAG